MSMYPAVKARPDLEETDGGTSWGQTGQTVPLWLPLQLGWGSPRNTELQICRGQPKKQNAQ